LSDRAEYVIAHVDKTVVKIHGLRIKGLNARTLEEKLTERLKSVVRVIGVTGCSIDMDIYGLDEQSILKDEHGIIRAISLSEGITATELSHIAYAKKIVSVDYNNVPDPDTGCSKVRWIDFNSKVDRSR